MAIMDRLTDKSEWHRKVFDEAIVSKWKEEAMAVPDKQWMAVAAAPKSVWADPAQRRVYTNGQMREGREVAQPVVGVMSEQAFNYVRLHYCYA